MWLLDTLIDSWSILERFRIAKIQKFLYVHYIWIISNFLWYLNNCCDLLKDSERIQNIADYSYPIIQVARDGSLD